MFATLWIWGFVSMTMGRPDMNLSECNMLKTQMETDISQIYITNPEMMVQNGKKVPRKDIWITCEPEELEIGFEGPWDE